MSCPKACPAWPVGIRSPSAPPFCSSCCERNSPPPNPTAKHPGVIVTTAKITEWMRAYRRDGVSEDRVNGDINALVKLGYLRRLRGSEDTYEARRIIKALVTADWLAEWRGRSSSPPVTT